MIVGSRPSGTFATISPIANATASSVGRPAATIPSGGRQADSDRDEGDEPSDAANLSLEWALLGPDTLGERGDPSYLRLHPGRVGERPSFTADARRSTEHEVTCIEQRPSRIVEVRRSEHGPRLPSQRREIDVERTLEQARIRRDPILPPRSGERLPAPTRGRRSAAADRRERRWPGPGGTGEAPQSHARPGAPARTRRSH